MILTNEHPTSSTKSVHLHEMDRSNGLQITLIQRPTRIGPTQKVLQAPIGHMANTICRESSQLNPIHLVSSKLIPVETC